VRQEPEIGVERRRIGKEREEGDMETLTVGLDLPRDMLGTLEVPESELGVRVRLLLALELYREGKISAGKAAEIAAVTKRDFVRFAGMRHGLPYFSERQGELSKQMERMMNVLQAEKS
jgi:predicted HTH domain antitoxin